MDFVDACTVVLRRWYVTLPLLVLTLLGTAFAYNRASAQYSARGSLELVLPAARDVGGVPEYCPTNPRCSRGDLLGLADVTARAMADPALEDRLLDDHDGASYEVVVDEDNDRSAIIEFGVSGETPRQTLATLEDVRAAIEEQLQIRQLESPGAAAIDPRDLVTASAVTQSIEAKPQTGAQLRSATAALALGLAATLGGAFLAESMARSRTPSTSLLDRIALHGRSSSSEAASEPGSPEPAVGRPETEPPGRVPVPSRPGPGRPRV
jgi:hypothetical protein